MISSLAACRRHRSRADRARAEAHKVIRKMRAGAMLSRSFEGGGSTWFLSTGERVGDAVARVVIADFRVVGVADTSLFRATSLAQVFVFEG